MKIICDQRDILVINPGSTSTKIALFDFNNLELKYENNIVHSDALINSFPTIAAQEEYRRNVIIKSLARENYDLNNLIAIVGRGGMLFGLKGGGYQIDDVMYKKMASPELPQHASSLGALLAYSIAEPLKIPSFIYDSTMGCELMDIAKISGMAGIEKYGATHLLNSRAQAMKYAQELGCDYKELNLINCHMGGGITVNAMSEGKVIDVASYDDGPMGPERSGGVPLLLFAKKLVDGGYSFEEAEKLVAGKGGVFSYLGTKDCREVEKMIEDGDSYAKTVYEAMAYQVAKAIASLSCAFKGKVDVIIITGGIAYSKMLVDMIESFCGHIAPIKIMPGEKEMEALAGGASRMLRGEEPINKYNDNI